MAIDYWAKFVPDSIYHCYNRSINKGLLFKSDENYTYFLSLWEKYLKSYVDVFAYCLMPTHYHFLIKIKPMDEKVRRAVDEEKTKTAVRLLSDDSLLPSFLEDQFKRLTSAYALAFNKAEDRHGSLFQKRFKRIKVNDNEKLLKLTHYIHHNPIHHGYAKKYENWRYSSYRAYLSDGATSVEKEAILKLFDEDHEKAKTGFFHFHQINRDFGDLGILRIEE